MHCGNPFNGHDREAKPDPQRLRRTQWGTVIAAGALFGLLVASGPAGIRPPSGPNASLLDSTTIPSQVPKMSASQQARLAELQEALSRARDPQERRRLAHELAHAYQEAGQPDRAATILTRLAQEQPSVDLWRQIGDLYTDWMLRQSEPGIREAILERAVGAYREALKLDPDNLDIRVDMAFCYAQSSQEPMRAVEELNAVLRSDSLHPRANLLLGLLRMQIGRFAQAIEAFDKVLARVASGSPLHEQAQLLRRQALARQQTRTEE
ncbi:MAG: tetratricopeptide repeat protein [Bacteroidota bacterium]|nr:tetratricopeptide repeat protein [Bacteroidota bacterium]MDW8138495.1 tetratricopeptide repeat protein [Bacteroidota bacterium]